MSLTGNNVDESFFKKETEDIVCKNYIGTSEMKCVRSSFF